MSTETQRRHPCAEPVGDETALHRQLLTILLPALGWLLIAVAVLYTIYNGFTHLTNPAISLATGLLYLGLSVAVRRGRVRTVAAAVVALLIATNVAVVYTIGTVHSTLVAFFLAPVILSTFLLGTRIGLLVFAVNTTIIYGFAQAELHHLLHAPSPSEPLGQGLNVVVLMASGLFVLALIRRTLLAALRQTRSELVARRSAEAALIQLTETLETRVRERTAALSAANAELVRAARLKNEFMASMSHELRTPLNVVLTMTESLGEELYGPVSDRQRAAFARIEQSGQHLLAQINDILDMAQLTANDPPLTLRSVPIERACATSIASVARKAEEKLIQVHYTADPHLGAIMADERRLGQILTNLLSNAVKFTERGGSIGLDAQPDQASGVLLLSVWDTGIGIAPADYERLFKPFVQVDGRLARRYEGTGLGLALVARLVELHCGSVTLETTVGHGTRVTVRLPLREAAPPAEGGGRQAVTSADRPVSVLLVDSSAFCVAQMRDALRAQGHRVEAATAADALAHARTQRPDVMVVDAQTPGLAGPDALWPIVAEPGSAGLRVSVIALATVVLPGDRERWLEAGAAAFLPKPAPLLELMRLVAR